VVLTKVVSPQPPQSFEDSKKLWGNKVLADCTLNTRSQIVILIGRDIFAEILTNGFIQEDKVIAGNNPKQNNYNQQSIKRNY